MKITDVTLTTFQWPGIPAIHFGRPLGSDPGESKLGLLSIKTDSGVIGHSFVGSTMRGVDVDTTAIIKVLKPIIMGQDPLQRERLYKAMVTQTKVIAFRPIGAVDIALWDIAGKVAGLPIYQLLGAFREKVPTYGTSSKWGSVDDYVNEAKQVVARGLGGYKIHLPKESWTSQRSVCEAVRAAVGPDYRLMVDAAMALNYGEAVRLGLLLQKLDYHWYEDPLGVEDIYQYRKLCAELAIPVMATEVSSGGLPGFVPWIASYATDMLRADVAIKGGITGVMKAAHLAEAHHMDIELHHAGNSLNNIANLHVAMAIGNCSAFEVLLPEDARTFGILNDTKVDDEGFVHALRGPGLGADIDFELINYNKLEEIS